MLVRFLLYAFLQQDRGLDGQVAERPASAIFIHEQLKVVCLSIRGTATINDVITDIRQTPVPFPEPEYGSNYAADSEDGVDDVKVLTGRLQRRTALQEQQ